MIILGGIVGAIAITIYALNKTNSINVITQFFGEIFKIIETTIQFIPQPFLTITLIFAPITMVVIIFKIVRG